MPTLPTPVQVRPFRRGDRDQLTALVNAHAQAVVPAAVVPTNLVLAQLEREPGEFIVDPWVGRRLTLVAEQRGRVVAAAHLLRYRDEPDVGADYRGAGEIRWLLQWPPAPYWPDAEEAGRSVLRAALVALQSSRVVRCDPSLPAPGVYGVPEQWPHIAHLLSEAGFVPGDRTEVVLLADTGRLAEASARAPVVRTLGSAGTRFAIGRSYVEVAIIGAEGSHAPGSRGWADVGNLCVDPPDRPEPLIAEAATWLRLGHVDRLLHYVDAEDAAGLAQATGAGFQVLTRTRRGWVRRSRP